MKIVHVCLTSNVFGKHYAYQDNLLSKAHAKLGHDVSIIAPTYSEFDKNTGKVISSPVGEEMIDNGIRLIRLRPALPTSTNQHIHMFCGLSKAIYSINPDLLFIHGVSSLNYRFFKRYKKKHPNVAIVFDSHADFNNSCKNKISYYYTKYIVKNFVVRKIKNITKIFYGVTPARCEFLHDMYGVPKEKIYLLPMGADDEYMLFDKKFEIRQNIRKQFGINNEDFLVVTGGKIDPLKNIHVLAKAVAESKYESIKMLIFGSIRDDLKQVFDPLFSNRIQYVGWLPSNEVYKYFYAADVVVFPGLHSVLWEQAVASQVPCAFSKIKGFEHVDFGGNCVLMEGKTADYYQSLMERLYIDPEYYNQLLEKSHSKLSNQFLYSIIAQKVLDDIKSEKS
jgi:glycosyltransferase involved in cell wall biosynthesis